MSDETDQAATVPAVDMKAEVTTNDGRPLEQRGQSARVSVATQHLSTTMLAVSSMMGASDALIGASVVELTQDSSSSFSRSAEMTAGMVDLSSMFRTPAATSLLDGLASLDSIADVDLDEHIELILNRIEMALDSNADERTQQKLWARLNVLETRSAGAMRARFEREVKSRYDEIREARLDARSLIEKMKSRA